MYEGKDVSVLLLSNKSKFPFFSIRENCRMTDSDHQRVESFRALQFPVLLLLSLTTTR